ncbi:hypothetical protein EAG_14055 [Camponotus floridanus]|uniref:Uncharacterized protein n=1 Tax=Camponotus floridanus TaxID=104421 RepID=E2AF65_CAMFO|nr:hypothetical protein EAG_14055 [Camponotus floridanus]
MARERWKDDIAYAMTPFKIITWPIGIWPLQIHNAYSLLRSILSTCCATKSPVMLQAGNYIVINLSTYVNILKTSFSYLSVLRIIVGV